MLKLQSLATWCKELTRWKNPAAGKDWGQEEKGATEDQMVVCHHQPDGHEFEQTLGDSEGQGSLACYSSWWWQRVRHDWATGQQTEVQRRKQMCYPTITKTCARTQIHMHTYRDTHPYKHRPYTCVRINTHRVHHMSCRKTFSPPISYVSLTCFYSMTLTSLTSRGFLQQVTLFLVKMFSFPGWDLVWAIHQTGDPIRMWGWSFTPPQCGCHTVQLNSDLLHLEMLSDPTR